MPNKYKNILIGYINDDKKTAGRKYLSIKNVSDADVVIEAGKSIFLSMTAQSVLDKNPAVPAFSKSEVIKDAEDNMGEVDITDDIPF